MGWMQRMGRWARKHLLRSRLAVGLVCVLVVTYTLYHLIGAFEGEISTFAAGVTTETKTLNYDGYVFRDEKVLYAPDRGLADYQVADGTKVTRGQALATVYDGGSSGDRALLRRLDGQIALLEESLEAITSSTDPVEVRRSVSDDYDQLIKLLASGESGRLSLSAHQFLGGLNQLEALSKGEEAEPVKTLEALKGKRAEMIAAAGSGSTYHAEASGYFYSEADGYETAFSLSVADSMTGAEFFELMMAEPEDVSTAYGKLAGSSEWRLVLPIALEEQHYFRVGEVREGLFEENNHTTLPLTVERILEVPEAASALVIFSCDRLPSDFSLTRRQNVRITVESMSGIYVPRDVTVRVDGDRGVYILRGNVVYFRYIDILYEGTDYYLVRDGIVDEEGFVYLQVNDLIIQSGKNLFDGRVLD